MPKQRIVNETEGVATGPDPYYVPLSFEEFFAAQYRPVLAFARAMTGSWAEAEDLTQDAFLAAHRQWQRVSAYERPEAFVRRVVANLGVSRFRRIVREIAALQRLRLRRLETAQAVDAVEDREFWDAIRRLSPRQHQVVTLHYLEDESVADIAAILGLAEGTVKAHLHAARAALAARLGDVLSEDRS